VNVVKVWVVECYAETGKIPGLGVRGVKPKRERERDRGEFLVGVYPDRKRLWNLIRKPDKH
jgi:hypothetical protein